MGFTIAGAALSRLVVMTDCPNALIEDLTETYQEKSSKEIEDGIRWFYCCGLGVALICTGKGPRYHVSFLLQLCVQPSFPLVIFTLLFRLNGSGNGFV
jgi:hypothetical protein